MMNGTAHDTSDDLCLNISMNASLQIDQKFKMLKRKKKPLLIIQLGGFKRSLPSDGDCYFSKMCIVWADHNWVVSLKAEPFLWSLIVTPAWNTAIKKPRAKSHKSKSKSSWDGTFKPVFFLYVQRIFKTKQFKILMRDK